MTTLKSLITLLILISVSESILCQNAQFSSSVSFSTVKIFVESREVLIDSIAITAKEDSVKNWDLDCVNHASVANNISQNISKGEFCADFYHEGQKTLSLNMCDMVDYLYGPINNDTQRKTVIQMANGDMVCVIKPAHRIPGVSSDAPENEQFRKHIPIDFVENLIISLICEE